MPGNIGNLGGFAIQKPGNRSQKFNQLIYGESGVGKTRLSGSADDVPEMRKVLVMDVEGGTETLRHTYGDVDVVRVKTWKEVQRLYDTLYVDLHGYTTIVIDSLTELQKFSMSQIMVDIVLAAEQKGETRDADIPSIREWGKNIEQIRRFTRAFRDLECNCIFTALVREDKDPMKGIIKKRPYLSGKLASEVAAFMDIVSFMYMREIPDPEDDNKMKPHRLLCSVATEDVTAKDRYNRLPQVMIDPVMKDIFAAVSV